MPFKSKAQNAKCWALKAKGQNGSWNCEEWADKTDFEHLRSTSTQAEKTSMSDISEQLAAALRDAGIDRSAAAARLPDPNWGGSALSQLAGTLVPSALGGGVGALLAPSGHRLEGAGRGALRGLGISAGAGLGGVAGAGLGALGGGALGAGLAPVGGTGAETGQNGAVGGLTGAGVGAIEGGLAGLGGGAYAGHKITDNLLGDPSWAKKEKHKKEKQAMSALIRQIGHEAVQNDLVEKLAADMQTSPELIQHLATALGVPPARLVKAAYANPQGFVALVKSAGLADRLKAIIGSVRNNVGPLPGVGLYPAGMGRNILMGTAAAGTAGALAGRAGLFGSPNSPGASPAAASAAPPDISAAKPAGTPVIPAAARPGTSSTALPAASPAVSPEMASSLRAALPMLGAGALGAGGGYMLGKSRKKKEEKEAADWPGPIGNSILAGSGNRIEGAGRGLISGAGTGLGARIGGRAGLSMAEKIMAHLGGHHDPRIRMLAGAGSVGTFLAGLFGGGLAGYGTTATMMGKPSWEAPPAPTASTVKAAAASCKSRQGKSKMDMPDQNNGTMTKLMKTARDLALKNFAKAYRKQAAAVLCDYLDSVAANLPLEKTAGVRALAKDVAQGVNLALAIKQACPELAPEARGVLAHQLVQSALAWQQRAA